MAFLWFLAPRALFCYFTWSQRLFFFCPIFESGEDILLKWSQVFCVPPQRARIQRGVRCRSAYLLQERPSAAAESSTPSPSPRLLKRAACRRHFTRCSAVSPAGPLRGYPSPLLPAVGFHSRTTSWQTEIDGENECRSFESAKNAEESKPAATKGESEGKSGRSRLERCSGHWKLVIGLNFTVHQRNRLPVSNPFLNCKWQQPLRM